MAYTPHFLLQLYGTVGTANPEIWSCGIRMWGSSYTGFDEVEYMEGVAKDAAAAWYARPNSKIGSHSSLDGIKFNFINEAGHYADPGNTQEYVYPVPVVGGATLTTPVYQVSLVLGWRTNDVERGYASKGRIYSPAPTVTNAASTGLFAAADALLIATSAALFLNTLDITVGTEPFRPHIMSKVDGSHHQIDHVVVDNRLDIQRRRANNLEPVESAAEILY